MPNSDSIREAVERLTRDEQKLLSELAELRVTIRTLKRTAGIETTTEDVEAQEGLPTPISEAVNASAPLPSGARPTIRPDEFFGATHAEAARRYLKRVGHAVSFEELVDVLQKGGCKLAGADPKKILYISLIRNSRDFVPPQPGYVGLREFYPARAKGANEQKSKQAKRSAKKSASRSTKSNQKPKASRKPKATEPPKKKAEEAASVEPKEPRQVPVVVHEFMSDKQFHSLDEVVNAVRKKLGDDIHPFSIRGALGKKIFEKGEHGYRLVAS